MNASHLHLVVNHMPMAFTIAALFVMLIGFIGKNSSIKKVSLGLMVLVALASGASFYSGGAAGEILEEDPRYHDRVEAHEESAEVTWIIGIVVGVVGLAGLLMGKKMNDVPTPVMLGALLSLLVASYFIAKTANLGGHIMHPETRSDAVSKFLNPGEG